MAKLGEAIGRAFFWKRESRADGLIDPQYAVIRNIAVGASRPGVQNIPEAFKQMEVLLTPDVIASSAYYNQLDPLAQMRVVELLVKGGRKGETEIVGGSGVRVRQIEDPRISQLLGGFLRHQISFNDGTRMIQPEDPNYMNEVRRYFSTWSGVDSVNLDHMSEKIGLPPRELRR